MLEGSEASLHAPPTLSAGTGELASFCDLYASTSACALAARSAFSASGKVFHIALIILVISGSFALGFLA